MNTPSYGRRRLINWGRKGGHTKKKKIAMILTLAALIEIISPSTVLLKGVESPLMALTPIKVQLGGIKWLSNSSLLFVEFRMENETRSIEVPVEHEQIIKAYAEFESKIPATFNVEVKEEEKSVLEAECILLKDSIKTTVTRYDEEKIGLLNDEDPLLNFEFTGLFFSVELLLPIKGDLETEGEVDGSKVEINIKSTSIGTFLILKNVLLASENPDFSIKVSSNGTLISLIEGTVSPQGLKNITLSGMIEKIEEKTEVTAGKHKGAVPVGKLRPVKIEEAGAVKKITKVIVTSETEIQGNVQVRLMAYKEGWFLEPPRLIEDAKFEVNITRLGITKIYKNNETAFLPIDEDVRITAHADGYVTESREIRTTKDLMMKEIIFTLKLSNPSLFEQIKESMERIIRSQYFIPAMLGFTIALIIIAIIKR
jgi:hypothetical protein